MKTLADLAALRKSAQESTRLREGEKGTRIIVGMGTCGIAAGARDVMAAIMDEISKRNIEDVVVTQTGCVGMCEREPIVEVIRQDMAKVTYGYVTAEKMRKIIAQHVVNGQIVGEYVIATK
jgi:NADP-reducing hydrogenase subunit HndB